MPMKSAIWGVLPLIGLLLLASTQSPSQDLIGGSRGIIRFVRNGEVKDRLLYEGSFALVIGMTNYRHLDRLPGAKADVEAVRAVLQEHGFRVETEYDLAGDQLPRRIEKFLKDYGHKDKRRLILYFAGHGHTMSSLDGREMGYIVPIDAPDPKVDETGFIAAALNLKRLKSFAEEIQTKHSLFVFDSCFSGLVMRGGEKIHPAHIEHRLENPVRQFITSGTGEQKVPDDSIFRRHFVAGLRGAGDTNRDGYVTASELFAYLWARVTDESKKHQTPTYDQIDHQNLKFGDMVFFLKQDARAMSYDQAWTEAKAKNTYQAYSMFINTYDGGKYKVEALELLMATHRDHVLQSGPPAVAPLADTALPALPVSTGAVSRGSPVRPLLFEFNTLTINEAGVASEKESRTRKSIEETLGDGVAIRLVEIPAGKFRMGSNKLGEKPIRDVQINSDFYMSIYEVTKKQWAAVANLPKYKIDLEKNPAKNLIGDNLPVVNIGWEEAEEFCERLSRFTGRTYTLPSEAEWEYAARAGTTTQFSFGPRISANVANFAAASESKEGVPGFSRNKLIEVGTLGFGNRWGLFDMHGNAAEWSQDGWANSYETAPKDGSARPGNSSQRVVRGGSYTGSALRVCSTCRNPSDMASEQIGFRVVMRSYVAQQ